MPMPMGAGPARRARPASSRRPASTLRFIGVYFIGIPAGGLGLLTPHVRGHFLLQHVLKMVLGLLINALKVGASPAERQGGRVRSLLGRGRSVASVGLGQPRT
eukprot:scaffold143970_cov130-Phaeocystis_antarctica.AAC.5